MTEKDQLADRLRRALADPRVTEKKMFGGICFLRQDHMLCGTGKQGFLLRVGKDQEADALSRPGASPMEMGGRRMQGFVWVDPGRCSERDLQDWVALAGRFVASLPTKSPRKKAAARSR